MSPIFSYIPINDLELNWGLIPSIIKRERERERDSEKKRNQDPARERGIKPGASVVRDPAHRETLPWPYLARGEARGAVNSFRLMIENGSCEQLGRIINHREKGKRRRAESHTHRPSSSRREESSSKLGTTGGHDGGGFLLQI